jgi:CheY-like chemotaxis protein
MIQRNGGDFLPRKRSTSGRWKCAGHIEGRVEVGRVMSMRLTYSQQELISRRSTLTSDLLPQVALSDALVHPSPNMKSWRILVVEDFKLFRDFVCSTLQETTEFRVAATASDGLEAIQRAEESQPDLILLDIGLPKLNGLEAAKQLRIVAPRAKVLILSENNDSDVVKAAMSDGCCGYVLKSDAAGELLPAMAKVLRGERFLSSGIASYAPKTRKP